MLPSRPCGWQPVVGLYFRVPPDWRCWPAGLAARPGAARRHVFDARLAHTLLANGVTELATRSTRDFDGFGFARVFDPLATAAR